MSKRVRVILLIISIIVIVALATYAWIIWNSPNNTELTMQIGQVAEVKFNKGNDISTTNMGPVLNPEIDGEITTFNARNKMNYDYVIDININITSIADELKTESLKYMILSSTSENGTYTNTSSGSFANMVVGNNLAGAATIKANATTYFKFILYIDGTVENNTDLMGKSINATLNVTASVKEPNPPALTDNLIPVKYDNTQNSWVKADSSNTNKDWYDYNNKKWANAVLVSSTNRSTYVNGDVGTVIPESDVLAYYVWIPRYKYKVFNINKTIGVDSYNAQTQGIDIIFEQGTSSTGTISCNYDFTITDGSLSEICNGNNGDYYTHPAFTFGDDEITGFWMSKFTLSSENPSLNNGGGATIELTPRVKPNTLFWRSNFAIYFWKVIYDMQKNDNIYGLNLSRTSVDSHMIKNIEWGAITYLTNSKYGKCSDNICIEVLNNSVNAGMYSGDNDYVSNVGQSTTGNITGIYDMAGGSYILVMGNMSSEAGVYKYNNTVSLTDQYYSYIGNEKYLDTYSYGTTINDQIAYNRARLGDSTAETSTWHHNNREFIYTEKPWGIRNFGSDNSSTKLFSFYGGHHTNFANGSTRSVLTVFPS